MILSGARHHDDPGLRARLLATSNALDLRIPRPAYPRCLLARLCLGEAAVVALLSVLLWLVLVALP
jgi:hypothetical protein